jgi:hypothetical protein
MVELISKSRQRSFPQSGAGRTGFWGVKLLLKTKKLGFPNFVRWELPTEAANIFFTPCIEFLGA